MSRLKLACGDGGEGGVDAVLRHHRPGFRERVTAAHDRPRPRGRPHLGHGLDLGRREGEVAQVDADGDQREEREEQDGDVDERHAALSGRLRHRRPPRPLP